MPFFLFFVGMAGFEPTTSSTPCWRDTGLRYIPFEYLFSNNLRLQRPKRFYRHLAWLNVIC